MPAPKIILYFTPNTKSVGRIPLSDIKFDQTKNDNKSRGIYEISLNHPCFIDGVCSSLKSSVKSTASLTFQSKCFGEKTKYVFRTNDYFEIWDIGDPDDEFCYFRGTVEQLSRSELGEERSVSLTLENAGGWILGDNSVYYLSPLIIIRNQAASKFFDPIKTKYGWLDKGGKQTDKYEKLEISKVKTPKQLLETLVNQIGNERVKLLKEDYYGNSEARKKVEYFTGANVAKNNLYVTDKISEMEGSILSILKKFEGRPFSELFMIETKQATKMVWRNSRWRDERENLCMGEFSGGPENVIILYADPKEQFASNREFTGTTGSDKYISSRQYSGFVSEQANQTTEDVINAIYVFPVGRHVKKSIPTIVADQTAFDPTGAKTILNIDSIIRNGYRPVTIDLPFIPRYMDAKAFNEAPAEERTKALAGNDKLMGEYLAEYTAYADKMYRNIENSDNGSTVFQNNLHITVADDYRMVKSNDEQNTFVNVHKITWYLQAQAPKTVLEWDRGFTKSRSEPAEKEVF